GGVAHDRSLVSAAGRHLQQVIAVAKINFPVRCPAEKERVVVLREYGFRNSPRESRVWQEIQTLHCFLLHGREGLSVCRKRQRLIVVCVIGNGANSRRRAEVISNLEAPKWFQIALVGDENTTATGQPNQIV